MGIDLTKPAAKVFDALRSVRLPKAKFLRLEKFVEGEGYKVLFDVLSGWTVEEASGDLSDDRTLGVRIADRHETTYDVMMRQVAAVVMIGESNRKIRYEVTGRKPPLGNPAVWRLLVIPTGELGETEEE